MNTTAQSDQITEGEVVTAPKKTKQRDGIGPYRLEALLAENATGTLFTASHKQLKHKCTLIVLPAFVEHDPNCVAKFTQEMGTINNVKHPNVLRVLDAGEDQGLHFIAMEHIDGVDLQTILQNENVIAPPAACEIVRQAAIGLHFIHEKGLLHRGIKPSNLILSRTGIVKIVGLGVAALQGSGLAAQAKDSLPSSANYLAPEQFKDEPSQQSDIYGLGCVLYRLLTGQLPPLAADENDELFRLSKVAPNLSPELGAVLSRMTAKNPEARFQNFKQVVAAMCNWANGEEIKSLVSNHGVSKRAKPAAAESAPTQQDASASAAASDNAHTNTHTAGAQADAKKSSQKVTNEPSSSNASALFGVLGVLALAGLAYAVFWSQKGKSEGPKRIGESAVVAPADTTTTGFTKDVSSAASASASSAVPASEDGYHASTREELAEEFGLKGGAWVLPADELKLANLAETYGHTAALTPSDGLPFSHAIRMDVSEAGTQPWDAGLYIPNVDGLHAGDCVVLVVWLRTADTSPAQTGRISVFAEDATTDTKEVYTTISPTADWQRYVIPFQATTDAVLRIGFHLAYQEQEIDYAGFTLVNYGNSVPHWDGTAAKMSSDR